MSSEIIPSPAGELVPVEPGALDRNPAAVYLASLSATGRRTMHQALTAIAGMLAPGADCLSFPWAAIRYQHAAAIRARLAEQYSPATANKMLCALRGTLRAAWRLGLMSADDYQLAASVESVTGSTIPAGRELTPGELSALMAACENDTTPAGVRDAAIIALMYSCGLRRDEVVKLDNYDADAGLVVIRGKRAKERTAYLVNGAKRAMDDWQALRGEWAGPVFCPVDKAGRLQQRAMTNQAIYNLLRKRAQLAGVKDFSPHDLRRTFVSDLLDAGADIATVAKMAGHASVQTTARYDRRPEQAKQKAAGLLHIPYRGRLV